MMYTSYATHSSGKLWNIPRFTCIFWDIARLYHEKGLHNFFITWLAPWAGKMNQIARCDWLPELARWSHLARSGLPAVSRKQNFTKSHIINPLLTKFVRSRWLDIGLVLFFASLWTSTSSRSINTQKKDLANIQPSWPLAWSITHTYHAIENTVARWGGWTWYSWIALIDGKVRWNCVFFFLHSHRLHFQWHGVNTCISIT